MLRNAKQCILERRTFYKYMNGVVLESVEAEKDLGHT